MIAYHVVSQHLSSFIFLSCLFLSFLCFSCLSFFVFRFLVLSFLYLLFFSFCFFFPIDLRLSCVCVVIGTTCKIYVVVFLRWQASGISRFFQARVVRRMHQYGPGTSTPDFTRICFWRKHELRQLRYMRVPPLVFFPGVFFSSRVTGACPVTPDLVMRVNVRTTRMILLTAVFSLPLNVAIHSK